MEVGEFGLFAKQIGFCSEGTKEESSTQNIGERIDEAEMEAPEDHSCKIGWLNEQYFEQ